MATDQFNEASKLIDRMLAQPVYAMLRDLQRPERVKYHIADHLHWMIAREKAGQIMASGPFVTPGGVPGTSSLTIIRAASLDEAWGIGEQDPFYLHELITFRIYEWRLMEGRFNVVLDLSDRTFRLT